MNGVKDGGSIKPSGRTNVDLTKAHAITTEDVREQAVGQAGCTECDGRGYFEYKTGVVSPNIPHVEEVAKEPCDCVLNGAQPSGTEAKRIRITHGNGWYADRVGEVFETYGRNIDDSGYYVVADDSVPIGYFPTVYDEDYVEMDAELAQIEKAVDDYIIEEGEVEAVAFSPSNVDHPRHYNEGDIEAIDYIDQVADSYEGRQAFYAANVIKYVSRAPHKKGAEDIRKLIWYAERLAAEMDATK